MTNVDRTTLSESRWGTARKMILNGSEQKEPLRGKQSGKQTGEPKHGVPWEGSDLSARRRRPRRRVWGRDEASAWSAPAAEGAGVPLMRRQRGPHQQRRGAGAPLLPDCSALPKSPVPQAPVPLGGQFSFLKPCIHELHLAQENPVCAPDGAYGQDFTLRLLLL